MTAEHGELIRQAGRRRGMEPVRPGRRQAEAHDFAGATMSYINKILMLKSI
jgi:hypothetical protein